MPLGDLRHFLIFADADVAAAAAVDADADVKPTLDWMS